MESWNSPFSLDRKMESCQNIKTVAGENGELWEFKPPFLYLPGHKIKYDLNNRKSKNPIKIIKINKSNAE